MRDRLLVTVCALTVLMTGPYASSAAGATCQSLATLSLPEATIASHRTGGTVDRTRPPCPYPQVAKWKGSGSTDDAANFACVRPASPPPPGVGKMY